MAKAPGNLDFLLSCQVCFEEFEEEGDHVPRLLPCTHTVCESCIKQLIKDKKLNCPECRTKHEAAREEKTFPQNKYLLAQIGRDTIRDTESDKCEEHGKELNMFCREPGCQKHICVSCMKDHRKHDVLNIEEKMKDDLLHDVDTLTNELEIKVKMGTNIKKYLATKTDECIEMLEKKKEELVDHLNTMIEEAKDIRKEKEHHVEEELSVVQEKLLCAKKIKQDVESEKDAENQEDLMSCISSVNKMAENTDQILSPVASYQYLVYRMSQASTETVLGCIDRTEIPVHELAKVGERSTAGASPVKCTVTKTVHTTIGFLHNIALLSDNLVAIFGAENRGLRNLVRSWVRDWRLQLYDLENGREISNIFLPEYPDSVAVVKIAGILRLALVYSTKPVIEFRDINNPSEVILIHSLAPEQPGNLCQMSASTLLYIDHTKIPHEVFRLDCSGIKPRPLPGRRLEIQQPGKSVCYVQDGDKQLLIIAAGDLCAYDLVRGELSWKVKMTEWNSRGARGVTSDGRGHLFVCDDKMRSIELYSVSDGKHLGCLINKGEQGLGGLARVTWCEKKSSLIVTQDRGSKWSISVIHLQYG